MLQLAHANYPRVALIRVLEVRKIRNKRDERYIRKAPCSDVNELLKFKNTILSFVFFIFTADY